jgi:hypothetical protein
MLNLFHSRHRTVATVGLQGHGKTVFLASLFRDSFFVLSETLRPFAVRAVSAKADDVFYGNAQALHDLELPPANPRGKPEPAILEFASVPRPASRWRRNIRLTFFDIAGEVFSSDRMAAEYAPFLADADDIIFLFDPTHQDFNALAAARLLDLVCRVTMKSSRKNLIVALSKMDELRGQDEWADLIGDLWPDAAPAQADLSAYFRQMERMSEMLRLWWSDPARQAQNLMNALPADVRFCALSSVGHQPVWDCAACHAVNSGRLTRCEKCQAARTNARMRLMKRPEPFRVRDPLFWIFRHAGVM